MSQLSSWKEFTPSFFFTGMGQQKALMEAAFNAGQPILENMLGSARTSDVEIEGVLDANSVDAAGPNRWLNFGHQPNGAGTYWSNYLAYRLTAKFDSDDVLQEVRLDVFLANPHFSVSLSDFLPARYTENNTKVELLADTGGRMGFALLSGLGDPGEDSAVYTQLAADLPAELFTAPSGNFEDLSQQTLLSRIDFSCLWARPTEKYLGTWVGVPVANPLEAAGKILRLALFSSATTSQVDAFVHESSKFVLRLPQGPLGTPTMILEAPKKPDNKAGPDEQAAWSFYRTACQEFGLEPNFKGFLFKGLEGSWLDDDLSFSSGTLDGKLDVVAMSFGDPKVQDGRDVIKFYFSISLFVRNNPNSPNPTRPFLGWFNAPAALRVSYGSTGFRYITLEGTFAAALDQPYQWFSERAFSLSVVKVPWKDPSGASRQEWSVELGLEKTDDKFLARIPIEGDNLLSAAVIALSFAPIIFMLRKPPEATGDVPDAQSRGYFVSVASNSSIAQVFAAAALGSFLTNRVKVQELRVTAAHLRSQPARINDPNAGELRETAFLLDYDVDYNVDLSEAGLKTTRAISSHVDGTGFVLRDGNARWVQVPNGAYELGLSDPGLWELGALGKILKIADIRLRKEEHTSLVVLLRLAQNFGGVKCDDFRISIDLQSGQIKFEAFPAEVEVEIGSVFKGRGVLHIGRTPEGESDVAGAIDLAFLSLGWRIYGALRITHVRDSSNQRHVALVAGLEVEWPTKIPLLNTGLGLSGLQLLYATHFMRKEGPKVGSIPPALDWFQKAGGNVPSSIEKPPLWVATYGHWTIGVGLEAGLMVSDTININGMLVLEEPGPRILVFVKVTLLQSKKKNEGNTELTGGILGVLDIDWEERTITIGVLANLSFAGLMDLHAPMEFGASMRQLSHWHAYLGHPLSPITIDLKIFTRLKGISAYLMFDGYQIVDLPQLGGGKKTLPGFAVAFGLWTSIRIGSNSLYIEVSFKTYVEISLSRVLYASGSAVLSGTIYIFGFDVGASGRWDFLFLREPSGHTEYRLSGSICGHIKVWTWKISGCVGLSIGSGVTDTTSLEDLIGEVSLISGAQAVLHGQGAFNAIDAIVGKATVGSVPSGQTFGLDSIVVLGMDVPPAIDVTGSGFAKVLPQPTPNAEYQLGTKRGKYTITGVTLQAKQAGGSLVDVDYANTPARWWRNVGKQEGGQPAPISLALLTRNPLSFDNAVISPGDPGGALDQLLDGLCDPPIAEQYAMYFAYPPLQHDLDDGNCAIQGVLGNSNLETDPGYRGITDLAVEVRNVSPADLPEAVRTLHEEVGGVEVPGIELHFFQKGLAKPIKVSPWLKLSSGGFWCKHLLQVLFAASPTYGPDNIARMFELRQGGNPISIRNNIDVVPLDANVLGSFSEDMPNWTTACRAFAKLNDAPQYAAHGLYLITVDLENLSLPGDPTDFLISLGDNEVLKAETLVVGPVKLTPSAEHQRLVDDAAHKQELQDELNDYLSGNDQPLLEPDREYVLTVGYLKSLGGHVTPDAAVRSFKTSALPPCKLDPYLLANYPAGVAAKSMPVGDAPAVLISTHDILRILENYGTRLKVTITHDGGANVTDSTSTMNWSAGETFDPADLRSLNPPKGIKTASDPGFPSATMDAIWKLIEEGKLPCITALPFDRALWIGFDVVLHGLSGYHVRFDLVDAGGNLIFPADLTNGASAAFYSFAFTTGLYSTMTELADRSANARPSRRLISDLPDVGAGRNDPAFPDVTIVPDKIIEDAVGEKTGERQAYAGEPDYSVLWKSNGKDLKPAAIWLRANEPVLMNTVLPRIGTVTAPDGSTTSRLLGQGDSPVWGPAQNNGSSLPVGVSRFVVSESGLTALLILNSAAGTSDLEVTLRRQWSWQDGVKVNEVRTLLRVPANRLQSQVAKLSAAFGGL